MFSLSNSRRRLSQRASADAHLQPELPTVANLEGDVMLRSFPPLRLRQLRSAARPPHAQCRTSMTAPTRVKYYHLFKTKRAASCSTAHASDGALSRRPDLRYRTMSNIRVTPAVVVLLSFATAEHNVDCNVSQIHPGGPKCNATAPVPLLHDATNTRFRISCEKAFSRQRSRLRFASTGGP